MRDVGFGRVAASVLSLVLTTFAIALPASPGTAAEPSAVTALEELARIHDAIARHRALVGSVPRSPNELGPVVRAHAPALEVRGGLVVDPWGTPYLYRPSTGDEDGAYALYSAGANGLDDAGRGDDIASRETLDRSLYPELHPGERWALTLFPILMVVVFGPLLVALMNRLRRSLT
jgi:hypothetical protein